MQVPLTKSSIKRFVYARKTCLRTPERPLPFVLHENLNELENSQLETDINKKLCGCKNFCGSIDDNYAQKILKKALDLREAGLIDIREGEKLELIGCYSEPRFLIRNAIGECKLLFIIFNKLYLVIICYNKCYKYLYIKKKTK